MRTEVLTWDVPPLRWPASPQRSRYRSKRQRRPLSGPVPTPKSEVFQGHPIRAVRTGTAAAHRTGRATPTSQAVPVRAAPATNCTTTTRIGRTTADIADPDQVPTIDATVDSRG